MPHHENTFCDKSRMADKIRVDIQHTIEAIGFLSENTIGALNTMSTGGIEDQRAVDPVFCQRS